MVCVRICNALYELKPVLVMFVSHLLSTGLNIIFKLIANDGMSLKVFSAYRVLFASAVMIPLALVFERLILASTICFPFFLLFVLFCFFSFIIFSKSSSTWHLKEFLQYA